VVLYRSTHRVRQFWVEQPNGNETTWDYEYEEIHDDRKPAVTRELILQGLPKGWKRIDGSPPAKEEH
jgi:hypothetical protein